MRIYIVVFIQLMIWSSFSLIEWLSKNDLYFYKLLMFLVFFYLAILIGNHIIRSTKLAFFVTVMSLMIYGSIHTVLSAINTNVFN
ncbi:hypothetical protein [Bacillus sp. 03113]|uniref:hypothetical protein n=1 Tax=Bacillus sp. 03113 TaxID=2578211 RepID=UPI0011427C08|nr:hypothetical protein [Bacillus sp. 03113]